MPIAASYPFLDVMWTMLVFFLWIIWFWILITVLMDIFRRHDIHGGGKVLWCIFVIILPYLGVFVYLISQSKGMAERSAAQQQAYQTQTDDYIRTVAAQGNPADQIAQGKELLDSGAITKEEFEALKARALAS
jgi:hypothetical protein